MPEILNILQLLSTDGCMIQAYNTSSSGKISYSAPQCFFALSLAKYIKSMPIQIKSESLELQCDTSLQTNKMAEKGSEFNPITGIEISKNQNSTSQISENTEKQKKESKDDLNAPELTISLSQKQVADITNELTLPMEQNEPGLPPEMSTKSDNLNPLARPSISTLNFFTGTSGTHNTATEQPLNRLFIPAEEVNTPNQRAGPIKIPNPSNNPVVSINSDDAQWLKEAAGPRINPSEKMDFKGEGKISKSPEEAAGFQNYREVFNIQSRPNDRFNHAFQKPINEFVRDNLGNSKKAEQTQIVQPSTHPAQSDKSRVEMPPNHQNRDFDMSKFQKEFAVPKIDSEVEVSYRPNEKPVEKPVQNFYEGNNKPKLNAEFAGNMKIEVFEGSAQKFSSKTSWNQDVAEPHNKSYEIPNLDNFGPNAFTAKSASTNPNVKSQAEVNLAASPKEGISTSDGFGTIVRIDGEKIIKSEEPIHVLDNIPTRIKSEFQRLESTDELNNELTTLRVQLKPPRLGALEIRISRSDEGLDVRMITRTAFAKEIISQRGEEIRHALEQNGFNLRKFEIISTSHDIYRHEQVGSFLNSHGMHHGNSGQEQFAQSPMIPSEEEVPEEEKLEVLSSLPDNRKEHRVLNIVV